MAYAALVSLSRAIDQILPQDELYIFLCAKDQIKSLHGKVVALQEFLEFVSGKSRSSELDALECRITDVSYQLEDIIESIIWRSLAQEIESDVDTQLDAFSSCVEQVDNLLEETTEVKKISENKDTPPGAFHSGATTSEVGLGGDLIQILDRIIGKGPKLQIVPITGMGGIGKTTLARAAYEHPRTRHHFDVCLWVTVSQQYNIQDILQGLLPGAERSEPEYRLIELVHKRLISRRFLIVLDDMWDDKVWDRVRIAFPDDNIGSRVILTTRLLGVAKNVGSSSPVHQMHLLNEENSWDLLQQKVYCPAEFEETGRTISRNCKGLPLAIVVISGLLKFNNTKNYWQEVARSTNNIHAAINDDDALFRILSLSYTNLPAHLKACFLYFGTYEEDYKIPSRELVLLWAAEGFLKPKGSKRMEEVAEECLEELVGRSLVLVTEKRYNGKIRTLSIHDTLRELSLRKSREERFVHHFGEGADEATFHKIIKEQRRVSFSTPDGLSEIEYDADAHDPLVRTFLNNSSVIYSQWFLNCKLLKVLKGVSISWNSMHSRLCRLTNLRYLHFTYHRERTINVPKSIAKLRNLETFIAARRRKVFNVDFIHTLMLPETIWEMPSLKHIISECRKTFVSPVPDKSPVLENLRILSGVRNMILSQNATRIFANLKKLKVTYSREWDAQYLRPNNFDDLHQLEELSVMFNNRVPRPAVFTFPHKLKKLSLKQTYISLEYMSVIGSLPNLEGLKLMSKSVVGDTWEPIEGEFAQLKYLVMEGLGIKNWRAESIHFPCLEKLHIRNCSSLEEVPAGIGEIESLQQLMVENCEDAKESVECISEEQKSFGNDLLQVKYATTARFSKQSRL